MKSAPAASSSDLERARQLSRSLRPALARPAGAAPRAAGSGYVRFQMAAAPPAPAPVPSPAPDVPPAIPAGLAGGALWNFLLDWCAAYVQAGTAFVMDGFGLLVAARGDLPPEQFEEVGGRLILILQQARLMQGAAVADLAVGIELGDGFLSGFQLLLDDGSPLTVGLIGREPISSHPRGVIRRTVRDALAAGRAV